MSTETTQLLLSTPLPLLGLAVILYLIRDSETSTVARRSKDLARWLSMIAIGIGIPVATSLSQLQALALSTTATSLGLRLLKRSQLIEIVASATAVSALVVDASL